VATNRSIWRWGLWLNIWSSSSPQETRPSLSRVFAVVERWHVEGDSYVREAATIGLLEDLQNENLHSSTVPKDFEVFLGPESLKWWRKVERLWAEGEIVSDD
jgi:hypothetical protein